MKSVEKAPKELKKKKSVGSLALIFLLFFVSNGVSFSKENVVLI